MCSDAISKARLSAFARTSAKNKKGSRLGKVKENKVDIRREQWMSQVKNKGCKVESNVAMGLSDYSFTGRRSSSSCSSSSSIDVEREYEHGCLDTWEAMADTLPCSDKNIKKRSLELDTDRIKGRGNLGSSRAWRPDDRFRPRTLPRVCTKHHQQHQHQQQQQKKKKIVMQNRIVVSEEETSVCPICCEDLDITDSSFLPCSCGFRLCLFCHNRILEVDARCPGCRNQYHSAGAGFHTQPLPVPVPVPVVAHSWTLNKKTF